ncbi:MAG: hypothetical protein JEZ10_08510 [Verrucomicrobia bacterium]|nr:hypothetical protein [Verrucomicrobiota bacterium]
MKTRTSLAGLMVVAGFAGAVFAEDVVKMDQVVFSEDFESYEVDQKLPTGTAWSTVSANESQNCFVHVRADVDKLFGKNKENKYLQVRDASGSSSVKALAKDIAGFESKLFRISFDVVEPDAGNTGAFGFKAGIEDISKNSGTVVNGVQLSQGKARPGLTYSMDEKLHFDVYINETDDSVKYETPDGKESRLKEGMCAVWIDEKCSSKGAGMLRTLKESVAATSIILQTFSSSTQEVLLDNIEIAVAK